MLPDFELPSFFWHVVVIIAAMGAWRLWGRHIILFVKRMDQRRRDADLQAYFDRMNPNAHFRLSVEKFEEETPAVEPFAKAPGASDPRAVWNNEIYATRAEADAARWRHIMINARNFYMDLDRMYGNRIRGRTAETIQRPNDEETRH